MVEDNQTITTNNKTNQPHTEIGDTPLPCSATCTTQLACQGKVKFDPTIGAWDEEVDTNCYWIFFCYGNTKSPAVRCF